MDETVGRLADYEMEGLPPNTSVQVVDGFVFIRHAGEVSFATSLVVLQRVAEDPRVPPGTPAIMDLLELELPTPSTAEIRAFVAAFGALKGQYSGQFAAVTDKTLHYGFARMISMLVELKGLETAVFRDLASAEAYIRGR